MADIDTGLIGQIISSIPYDQAFGGPLQAAIEAQTKAAKSSLDFIMNVGFTTNKDGIKETTYAEMVYSEQKPNGEQTSKTLRMPLITLFNIPQIEIYEGEVSFDLEISQNATMKDCVAAEGELEGKVGWGPFSVSLKAKASYNKERTRSTDTRAKQHVIMKLRQSAMPEGLAIMLEIMRNAAVGVDSHPSVEALPDNVKRIPAQPQPAGDDAA